MVARRKAAIAAAFALLMATSGLAQAHALHPWYASSVSLWKATTTWRTSSDSLEARGAFTWSTTNASNMRHNAAGGWRFTHDVHEITGNGNATGRYATDLPNPYYDRDPSGTSGRHEEGEITADSTTFPTANHTYASYIEFSHWWYLCGTVCSWKWARTAADSR